MTSRVLLPTAEQLEAVPTLSESHTCDMKYDDGEVRLFLSRCDTRDGEPFDNAVYLEIKDERGRWIDHGCYDGDSATRDLSGISGSYFNDFKEYADELIEGES